MNKKLTIVLISYKSQRLILTHIKKYYKKFKFIVVDNSYDLKFKKQLAKKYKNVDIYLKKNIGYGKAVNFASKKIKTKYFVSMNPDALLYHNTFKNLLKAALQIKKFAVISPTPINSKQNKNNNFIFTEKKKINSPVMLFETQIFKNVKGFDENYFLYYEDNDFFRKCNNLNLKLYLINNSYYNHLKPNKFDKSLNVKSSSFINREEKNYSYLIGGWHGQWSKFYYLKKYNGYVNALILSLPSLIIILIQLIIYLFYDISRAKYKYFKIEGLLCSLIGTPSFKRSKFDKYKHS